MVTGGQGEAFCVQDCVGDPGAGRGSRAHRGGPAAARGDCLQVGIQALWAPLRNWESTHIYMVMLSQKERD